jgi:aminoglycoside phosphotransferase family enzyme
MAVNAPHGQETTLAYQYLRIGIDKRHGVVLPNLYLDLILQRRLTIRAAVRAFKLGDTGYKRIEKH